MSIATRLAPAAQHMPFTRFHVTRGQIGEIVDG